MKSMMLAGLVVVMGLSVLAGCGGPSREDLMQQGVSQLQLGQLEPAKETFMRVLRAAPSDAEAHFYLGQVFYAQRFYEQALSEYKFTLDADPAFPNIKKYISDAQRMAGTAGPEQLRLPEPGKTQPPPESSAEGAEAIPETP